MARQAYHGLPPTRSAAVLKRDAALARVARVRRATIVGAGALTAALAGVVSAIAPGRTLGAKLKVSSAATTATVTRRPASATTERMPPLANPAQLGLQAPGSPPQAPSPPPSPTPAAPAPAPAQAAPAPAAPAPAVSGGS